MHCQLVNGTQLWVHAGLEVKSGEQLCAWVPPGQDTKRYTDWSAVSPAEEDTKYQIN